MPIDKNTKLFQTIGELYIVYIQSKKFLSEETLWTKVPTKRMHDELENIFKDLTHLQQYQNDPSKLLRLCNVYHIASSLDLVLKNTENVTNENWKDFYKHYRNMWTLVKPVHYKTNKIINDQVNYKHFLHECIKNEINRMKNLDTKINNSGHDKSIIHSDWLKELSEELDDLEQFYGNFILTQSFQNSLVHFGFDLSSKYYLSQELNKLYNPYLQKTYIQIGKALFHKNKLTDEEMVNDYLYVLQLLQNKSKSDYNSEPSFDEYSHEHKITTIAADIDEDIAPDIHENFIHEFDI